MWLSHSYNSLAIQTFQFAIELFFSLFMLFAVRRSAVLKNIF